MLVNTISLSISDKLTVLIPFPTPFFSTHPFFKVTTPFHLLHPHPCQLQHLEQFREPCQETSCPAYCCAAPPPICCSTACLKRLALAREQVKHSEKADRGKQQVPSWQQTEQDLTFLPRDLSNPQLDGVALQSLFIFQRHQRSSMLHFALLLQKNSKRLLKNLVNALNFHDKNCNCH